MCRKWAAAAAAPLLPELSLRPPGVMIHPPPAPPLVLALHPPGVLHKSQINKIQFPSKYRLVHMVVDWVRLTTFRRVFHNLPNPAWADGNLAELAGKLGKMVEHPNQS